MLGFRQSTAAEIERLYPVTIIPATATEPEIQLLDSVVEVSYQFQRVQPSNNATFAGFVLTHFDIINDHELHLALMSGTSEDDLDLVEDVHFTYAEAKILRTFLNRPEVARWLDAAAE